MNIEEIFSYVSLVSALVAPITALVVTYIAYQQWKTVKNQLKHELYGKRFILYKAAQRYISEVLCGNLSHMESTQVYLESISASQWLVDKKLSEFLKVEIVTNAADLRLLNDEIGSLPVGEERSINIKKQRELRDWFEHQKEHLVHVFDIYLSL